MRLNKLDLNQLVVLDAVLSERSVKRAAERLFLSPPAASCALARLRDYFKDDLLVQVGKTMVLTPRAESMQKPVRDVLLQIQAIVTMDPSFDPMTSTRKITIEASDYVMNVFLAEVLRQAWHEAPQMKFDLRKRRSGYVDWTGFLQVAGSSERAAVRGHVVLPDLDRQRGCAGRAQSG
jgi:DNA-binding transcriptional LysR family regulator